VLSGRSVKDLIGIKKAASTCATGVLASGNNSAMHKDYTTTALTFVGADVDPRLFAGEEAVLWGMRRSVAVI
jgi:hypothetical protein